MDNSKYVPGQNPRTPTSGREGRKGRETGGEERRVEGIGGNSSLEYVITTHTRRGAKGRGGRGKGEGKGERREERDRGYGE